MPILYKVEDAIGRITLNRPEKRNALSDELIEVLKDTLALAAEDEQVRVVLINAAGQDFCAGADLAALDRTAEAGVLQHLETAHNLADLFLAIRHHPKPVIAAVHGRAEVFIEFFVLLGISRVVPRDSDGPLLIHGHHRLKLPHRVRDIGVELFRRGPCVAAVR